MPEPLEPVLGEELLRARDVLAQRRADGGGPSGAPPDGVVFCHQGGLVGAAISRWRTRRLRGFSADIRLLRRTRGRVAVATRFGVGAPAAVALFEELLAFGVQRFVSIGIAGGLRGDAKVGDLIVAERALCDDGTSAQYLATGGIVEASGPLTRRFADALERVACPYTMGALCSTDAPYRTTRAAVERWAASGGMAVDMEAGGLLAAARHRRVDLAVACCVADQLVRGGWRLSFDKAAVASGVRSLFHAAVEALEPPDGSSR